MTTRAHVTSILKEIDADGNLVEFLRHISAYLSWKLTPPWWKRKESVKERAMQMNFVANVLDVINLQYLGVNFYGFFDFRKTLRRSGYKWGLGGMSKITKRQTNRQLYPDIQNRYRGFSLATTDVNHHYDGAWMHTMNSRCWMYNSTCLLAV